VKIKRGKYDATQSAINIRKLQRREMDLARHVFPRFISGTKNKL